MAKSALSEVSFGSVTIQKLRRITLDANLLRTLGLGEGDSVEIALVVETGDVVLRKPKGVSVRASAPKSAGK